MGRRLTAAGTQMGPVQLADSRSDLVKRLIVTLRDAAVCANYKTTVFDFENYRIPAAYRRITEQRGVVLPEEATA